MPTARFLTVRPLIYFPRTVIGKKPTTASCAARQQHVAWPTNHCGIVDYANVSVRKKSIDNTPLPLFSHARKNSKSHDKVNLFTVNQFKHESEASRASKIQFTTRQGRPRRWVSNHLVVAGLEG